MTTTLTVVQPTDQAPEQPYDGQLDSLMSWQHAVAARRLEHVVADAFQTYLSAVKTRPGLTVSGHVMRELVRLHPGVLDALQAPQPKETLLQSSAPTVTA